MQISDKHTIALIKRHGVIKSNECDIRAHCFYGVQINSDELYVSYQTTNGYLYASPIMWHGGSRVQYVASEGTEIRFYVWANSDTISGSESSVGLEVFNDKGNTVYSSTHLTMSPRDFVYIGTKSIKNITWENAWDKFFSLTTERSYTYNGISPFVTPFATPWGHRTETIAAHSDYNAVVREIAPFCFYFNGGSVSTVSKARLVSYLDFYPYSGQWSTYITHVNGFGNVDDIISVVSVYDGGGKIDYWSFQGIVSFSYLFNIVEEI